MVSDRTPENRLELTHASVFSGIGGFDFGFARAGIKTLWQIEIEPYCRRVLAKHFPNAIQKGNINRCFPKSISSRAVSPAKTSALPAKAPALPAPVRDSGGQWCVPFAWYDRSTSSWKTWQLCLTGEWESWSAIWPRAGMTRNGIAYERPTLVLRTNEKESGSWPTPMPLDDQAVKSWPTPHGFGMDGHGSELSVAVGVAQGISRSKRSARKIWPTPTAQDAENDGGQSQFFRHSVPLNAAVKLFPTPKASPSGPDYAKATRLSADQSGDDLATFVAREHFLTPTVSDIKNRGCMKDKVVQKLIAKGQQISLSQSMPDSGQLNPTWVEWLMGYPLGWTALEDSATRSSRKSRNSSRAKS
jgi:hypothetical protein